MKSTNNAMTVMTKELEKWRLNARKFKTSSLLSSSKIKVQLAKLESRSSVEQVNLIQTEVCKFYYLCCKFYYLKYIYLKVEL